MTFKKQLSDWQLLLLQFPEMLRVLYSNFFSIILPLSILLERKKKMLRQLFGLWKCQKTKQTKTLKSSFWFSNFFRISYNILRPNQDFSPYLSVWDFLFLQVSIKIENGRINIMLKWLQTKYGSWDKIRNFKKTLFLIWICILNLVMGTGKTWAGNPLHL